MLYSRVKKIVTVQRNVIPSGIYSDVVTKCTQKVLTLGQNRPFKADRAEQLQKILFVAILFMIFGATTATQAQVGLDFFRAEPANLYDWRAAMVNPSIGALQTGAVEAGFKIFHLGFADAGAALFKAGYFVLNVPKRLPFELTAGLQTQHFTTPLYNESSLRVALSRRFSPKLALGIGIGMLGISYQASEFELDDFSDPVLAGGTSLWRPDLHLGLTFMPFSTVIVAAGVSHLNRPNLSLVDDAVRLEPVFTFGLKYSLGRAQMQTGGTIDRTSVSRRASVQYTDEALGFVQIGVDDEAISLLSRLNVSGPLSVGYGASLPINELSGTAAGSHEAAFIYEFDRLQKPIELVEVPERRMPIKPEMARIRVVPQFLTRLEHSTVDIVTKNVVREVSQNLAEDAIQQLTSYDLGLTDTMSIGTPLFLTNQFERFDPAGETGNLITLEGESGLYFEKNFDFSLQDTAKTKEDFFFTTDTSYIAFLRELGRDLKNNPAKKTMIVTSNEQLTRARLIVKFLSDSLQIPASQYLVKVVPSELVDADQPVRQRWRPDSLSRQEVIRLADPQHVLISVFPIDTSSHFKPWQFVVERSDGTRIFTYRGISTDQQQQFRWEWRDNDGRLIDNGFYRYYVEWEDDSGQTIQSAPKMLYARELRSTVHIQIAPQYQRDQKP